MRSNIDSLLSYRRTISSLLISYSAQNIRLYLSSTSCTCLLTRLSPDFSYSSDSLSLALWWHSNSSLISDC